MLPHTKVSSKQIKDLSVKDRLSFQKKREYLNNLRVRIDFLNRTKQKIH